MSMAEHISLKQFFCNVAIGTKLTQSTHLSTPQTHIHLHLRYVIRRRKEKEEEEERKEKIKG